MMKRPSIRFVITENTVNLIMRVCYIQDSLYQGNLYKVRQNPRARHFFVIP